MLGKGLSLPFLTSRDQSASTRARIDVLTDELSSGRRTDVGRAVSSDFSPISRIVHDLRTNDAKGAALARAATWLETSQISLDVIGQANQRIMSQLPAALASPTSDRIEALALTARGSLADMGAALGAAQNGRAIFANGSAGAGRPVDVDVIRSETRAIAQDSTDINGFLAAMDDYFAPAPGNGIDAKAISPYDAGPIDFPIGDGASFEVPVSLADPGIREALKQAAIVAALPDLGFPVSTSTGPRLAQELPARGLQAAAAVISTRGRLGGVEERVAGLSDRLSAETARLRSRQSDVLAADPFDTATRLQNDMTRLETIFAVTARRARLRLTDFIR